MLPYPGAVPLAGASLDGACVDGGTSVKPDEPDSPDELEELDGVVVVDDAA
jgi:hypothetical protein